MLEFLDIEIGLLEKEDPAWKKVHRGLPWREEDMAMFLLMFPARLNIIQNSSCTEVVCSYVRFGIYLRTKNINRKLTIKLQLNLC